MLSERPDLSVVVTQYPSGLLKILVIVPPKGPFTWFHSEELNGGSGRSGKTGAIYSNSRSSSSDSSSSELSSSSESSSGLISSSDDISMRLGPVPWSSEQADKIRNNKIKSVRYLFFFLHLKKY